MKNTPYFLKITVWDLGVSYLFNKKALFKENVFLNHHFHVTDCCGGRQTEKKPHLFKFRETNYSRSSRAPSGGNLLHILPYPPSLQDMDNELVFLTSKDA